MFARFDENPAMTLRVIKETKRYGRTDARTDGPTDGRTDNVKTVYPLQTKFAGGIISEIILNLDHEEEMSFKDISYLELWQPFCSVEQNIGAILVKGTMRNNSVKLF